MRDHINRFRPNPRMPGPSIALIAVAALLAAGCGGSDDRGGADSASTVPVSPQLAPAATAAPAESDAPSTPNTEPAQARMLRVATTPGWESIVEPVLSSLNLIGGAAPTFELDVAWMDTNASEEIEQLIVSAVASGDLDAGYVGVRSLSALGATGFDALVAPGLVDSYELQAAVLASDIPSRLLPTLDSLGVVALGLVPGPLRYPIGVTRSFVVPEDYAGATFHTFPGEVNDATATALGAVHSQLWGGERDDAIDGGMIDVTENSLDWARNNGRGSHVTLDPLWPATGVFIVNAGLLAGLPAAQAEAVRSAIAGTSNVTDLLEHDTEVIDALCAAGKQFTVPSADDRSALMSALQPVYDAITTDAAAGAILDQILALKTTVTASRVASPAECSAAPALAGGTDDASVLNGDYTLEWTMEELMAELDADVGTAMGNDGPFVLTLEEGTFNMVWQDLPDEPCGGTYGVTGNRVQLVAATDPQTWTCGGESLGELVIDAAWTLAGDQLVLSDFVISPEPDFTWWNAGFFSKPLTRVS